MRVECDRFNGLACVHRLRVLDDRRGEYVAQLLGTHIGDFFGQEYLKEIILVQMEVIKKSPVNVQVRFFRTWMRTIFGWPANGCIKAFIGCWFFLWGV